MGKNMNIQYYTAKEAAMILRVHTETIKRWLRDKQLKGRKTGRLWRIPVSEVVAKER